MICISVHTFLLLPDNRLGEHSLWSGCSRCNHITWNYLNPFIDYHLVVELAYEVCCLFVYLLKIYSVWWYERKSWCWGTKYVISTSIIQVFAKKYFWSQYLMKGCWIELLMGGEKWRPHCIIPFFNWNSFWWIMIFYVKVCLLYLLLIIYMIIQFWHWYCGE